MTVSSGTVTIGSEPTYICTVGAGGVLLCPSAAGVFIGGENVATSGENMGVPLPAGVPTWMPGAAPFDMPVLGASVNYAHLFGVSDGGGQVSFAAPQPRVV